MNESNVVNVTLNPIPGVRVSSYVVRIALSSNPAIVIDETEIESGGSLSVQFSKLTNGETYRVTAISKLGAFESQPAVIGTTSLRKQSAELNLFICLENAMVSA